VAEKGRLSHAGLPQRHNLKFIGVRWLPRESNSLNSLTRKVLTQSVEEQRLALIADDFERGDGLRIGASLSAPGGLLEMSAALN
jgi:hypothetical protein